MATFLHPEDEGRELALEDVFLVPRFWQGGSRREGSLAPDDFTGSSQPLVVANMNAVTGRRMAETMARFGGIGILSQDMSEASLARTIAHIKQAHPWCCTALTVPRSEQVRTVRDIIFKRSHGMVVVIDDDGKPIGVISHSDIEGKDPYVRTGAVMSNNLTLLDLGMTDSEAFMALRRAHIEAAPVVDTDGVLVGVVSRNDLAAKALISPSLDAQGRLQVAVAIGVNGDPAQRAEFAIDLGADALLVDTAHGAQQKMLDAIKAVRGAIGTDVPIIAGTVCTGAHTELLLKAGADIVKVNVGPGAMCTTRIKTGVGRPSFTSVLECAAAARERGKHVWADGAVREPRDAALYLAAGASRVMCGTMFAGTYESPGEVKRDEQGSLFKENFGMASGRAVQNRNEGVDHYEAAIRGLFREGISQSRIYLRKGRASVAQIVAEFSAGLMSTCTYSGARTLDALHANAIIGVQTQSGYGEGTPHGRIRK